MKAVSFIALALSLASALVAGGAYYRIRSQRPAPAGGADPALESRIARLEASLRDPKLPKVEDRAPDTGHAHGPDELDALRRRVENLEKQVGSGRYSPDGGRSVKTSQAAVDELKKRMANSSLPLRARAQALGALRGQQANKTDDVADAALALFAEASSDPATRALILRNLRTADNARLVDPLIQILKNDADEDVRDEAARLLGDYLSAKPEVKAALEQAAANDASAKVKRSAQAALAGPSRPR